MFEVIGERINTSRKLVQAAVANRNADYIIEDVQKQQEAGATFIDVNAGVKSCPGLEVRNLKIVHHEVMGGVRLVVNDRTVVNGLKALTAKMLPCRFITFFRKLITRRYNRLCLVNALLFTSVHGSPRHSKVQKT